MDTILSLAGLRFLFRTERELAIDPELHNFIVRSGTGADVTVQISRAWETLALPDVPQLGEDLLCSYRRQGDTFYCLAKGGAKGFTACSVYGADCREILCVINENPFRFPIQSLGSILRVMPMRAIFRQFEALFFHASRIAFQEKAILFTAPSGTGKTTQSRLWRRFRNADILCNDRTLVRKQDGVWYTYGYPLDGSEPVRSNAVTPLGAVVLLKQGAENNAERIHPTRAAALLMGQLVIEGWNPAAQNAAVEGILSLIADVPVYLLTCTPDEKAVAALEKRLIKDGVISYG